MAKVPIWITLLAAIVAGCAPTGPLVREALDPRTGATIVSATTPLIFYRDNSAHAAHARDYLYLGPIEVNTMGEYAYFIWLGIWGTTEPDRRESLQRDGFESIVVFADGEPLPLDFAGWTLDTIGASEPVYLQPVAGAADAYYRVTIDQVRMIADARDIEIRVEAIRSRSYQMWENQLSANTAMRAFVARSID
jgi:hypothetical protein